MSKTIWIATLLIMGLVVSFQPLEFYIYQILFLIILQSCWIWMASRVIQLDLAADSISKQFVSVNMSTRIRWRVLEFYLR